MAAFAAYLGASQRGARSPRRRALVLMSALGHLGLLVIAATVGVREAPAAAPEPVLVRLTAPPGKPRAAPAPAPPRKPSKPRSAPHPRLARPVLAPPVETPPPPDQADVDAPSEETPADAPGVPGGVPAPAPDAPFELREVARPPSVIARVTPAYPREARRDRVEGTVVLRVIVGIDGAVERSHTRLIRSVPALDAAAITAIESWRFSPAIGHSGRPVRVIIEVPFQFYLR